MASSVCVSLCYSMPLKQLVLTDKAGLSHVQDILNEGLMMTNMVMMMMMMMMTTTTIQKSH